jgi:Coenzyme PQQ synthesis protein D (PqqD)
MAHDKAHLRTVVNQDGAAVLDTERGTISTLNTTGAYIWQALERGEREEEIVDGLARETGESPDAIRNDVNDFIAALHEHAMLPS